MIKHFNEMRLDGATRGYKVTGRKLLPRDASECQFGKSARERNQRIAGELRVNTERHGDLSDGYERRIVRAREALSARRASYVERMFHSMVTGDHAEVTYQAAFLSLGHAQWRYFSALDADWSVRMAQDADDNLLSYARG